MSRPLRVEFPGALYHVTSRGDRRETIYLDDADRQHWLLARPLWPCLPALKLDMPRLLPHGQPLPHRRGAGRRQFERRHATAQRASTHKRTHGRVGHVFQGRFKAVIAQRESYLLELARYVVLNPVRAGMCALPELWPWSSYRATVGSAAPPEWLQTAWLLSQFGGQPATHTSPMCAPALACPAYKSI